MIHDINFDKISAVFGSGNYRCVCNYEGGGSGGLPSKALEGDEISAQKGCEERCCNSFVNGNHPVSWKMQPACAPNMDRRCILPQIIWQGACSIAV